MNNRELDVLIAKKIMGLNPCTFRVSGSISGWATAWSCEHKDSTQCYPSNQDAIDHPHSILPQYTTKIEHAWLLTEKFSVNLSERTDNRWYCLAVERGGWRSGLGDAQTAQLALCRAVLNIYDRSN